MTMFDERERAFEAKFASDERLAFKAQAKRDRLLAEWAGAKLGLVGDALDGYVLEVWREDLKHPGDEDVFAKVIGDFDAKSLHVPADEVRQAMRRFMIEARDQVARNDG